MELSTDVTPQCKLIILSVTNIGSNSVDVVSVTCVGSVITLFKLFNKVISLKVCIFGLRRSSFKVEECKSHVLIRTLSYFSKWKR